jgi:hypothetical protein
MNQAASRNIILSTQLEIKHIHAADVSGPVLTRVHATVPVCDMIYT